MLKVGFDEAILRSQCISFVIGLIAGSISIYCGGGLTASVVTTAFVSSFLRFTFKKKEV